MSTAGSSYEAWKESLQQAEAAGETDWYDDSAPVTSGLGVMTEHKEVWAGLVIGVGLLIGSSVLLLFNIRHLAQGERTVGIVTGHRDFYNRRTGKVRAPVVNYSTPGGVYKVVGSLSVARSMYPIDKEVPVLYLRDDPSNAIIADFVQLFLIPTVVGSLGLICITATAAFSLWIVRSELAGQPSSSVRQWNLQPPLATPASGGQSTPESGAGQHVTEPVVQR